MVTKKTMLKPSLQRIEDARDGIKYRIVEERSRPFPDQVLVTQLKKEKLQIKEMIGHLCMNSRVRVTKQYVFNMSDRVLELLCEFLQTELSTMLRGGKNDKSHDYVNCQNERNVVLAEQEMRAERLAAAPTEVETADAA